MIVEPLGIRPRVDDVALCGGRSAVAAVCIAAERPPLIRPRQGIDGDDVSRFVMMQI